MFFGFMRAVLAQAEAPSGAGGNPLAQLWFFVPLILIFWLLILRPQKKERGRRKQMIADLKKNDRVVTIGGIHGTVKKVEESEAVLAIDEGAREKVRIRISKSAIHSVEGAQEGQDEPSSLPEPEG